jgi:hypothetical protein
MITEQEAIGRARELVRREQLRVRDVRSVCETPAPEFLPEGVTRQRLVTRVRLGPATGRDSKSGLLEIIVDRETGEATGIEGL